MVHEVIYSGWISVEDYGESMDALMLSSLEQPLLEELQGTISGKLVTCRYWTSNKECSLDEAKESFVRHLHGQLDAQFEMRYSEITGYLWTDEHLNIGGHDLMGELMSHDGKWLILQFHIH